MARILHTADVHLAADKPERREALDAVLELAVGEDADLVTVGGDLFDSEVDANELRPDLRDRFSDLPFSVLTIPGNHDEAAFQDDLFFGTDFRAAVEDPFEHVTVDDNLRITCLPYTPRPTDDVLLALAERTPFDGTEVLMLHCSLEAPFSDRTTGDEATQRYFPIGKATLAELDFEYYLAGHFHSPHRIELPNGATFVYPGSPASVTRSELGQRSAALLDTGGESLGLVALDTFHYDHREFSVAPGEEDATLGAIKRWVDNRVDRNVEASITVTGHVDSDEQTFAEALESVSGPFPVENRTASVATVLANPLYQSFVEELETREFEEEVLREAVRQRTIKVFSELEAGGRFS